MLPLPSKSIDEHPARHLDRRSALRLTLGGAWFACSGTAFANKPPSDVEQILRLQVFLDNHHFSPGAIDGQMGQFTQSALAFYNLQQQRQQDDWSTVLKEAERAIPESLTTHRITEAESRRIASLPKSVADRAKLKQLPYTSLAEFIAERYHIRESFLGKLNRGLDLKNAAAGDLVVVPHVKEVFRIENIPKLKHFPEDASKKACHVFVDTSKRVASIYRSTTLLAAFPITHGRPNVVPRGRWRIQNMLTTPTFRWDERMLKEGEPSENFHILPPGPNNPVGILWAGVNKRGIGLHGTDSPDTIGRSQSAGCIRFANWDAIRLPRFLSPGSEVIIR